MGFFSDKLESTSKLTFDELVKFYKDRISPESYKLILYRYAQEAKLKYDKADEKEINLFANIQVINQLSRGDIYNFGFNKNRILQKYVGRIKSINNQLSSIDQKTASLLYRIATSLNQDALNERRMLREEKSDCEKKATLYLAEQDYWQNLKSTKKAMLLMAYNKGLIDLSNNAMEEWMQKIVDNLNKLESQTSEVKEIEK